MGLSTAATSFYATALGAYTTALTLTRTLSLSLTLTLTRTRILTLTLTRRARPDRCGAAPRAMLRHVWQARRPPPARPWRRAHVRVAAVRLLPRRVLLQ